MLRAPRTFIAMALLFLPFITALPATAQQSNATRECLRLDKNQPIYSGDNPGIYRSAVKDWVAVCREANASDGANNPEARISFGRALYSDGQHEAALPFLREAAARGDVEANVTIFGLHHSWSRGDLGRPGTVSRAEGEAALRKAAELNDPYAMNRLAALLSRGTIVKRDPVQARYWLEKALANPQKGDRREDNRMARGIMLGKSADPKERAQGIAILESFPRGDAQAELAKIIRADQPERARALLESAYSTFAGHARRPLADMLLNGEGGPPDVRRALKLLHEKTDVVTHLDLLARLYAQGAVVPRDVQKAVTYYWRASQWNLEAQLNMMRLLAAHPQTRADYPGRLLYDATEAAELGEPGAMAGLIDLKLSDNAQFRDVAGGCALVRTAISRGDKLAALHASECSAN